MFERLRESMRQFMAGAPPEERRAALSRMRDTLVQAKVGLSEMRDGVAKSRERVTSGRAELETVRRRKQMAEGIKDAETVAVATKYETQVAERLAIAEQKLAAQEAELAIAEREVEEMTAELKQASLGTAPGVGTVGEGADATKRAREEVDALTDNGAPLKEELDALDRQRRRAAQQEAAEARLAELKRRMGQ